MKKIRLSALIPLLISVKSFALPSYDEAKQTLGNAPDHVRQVVEDSPTTYSFPGRFDGKDSVSFPLPTLQHILASDLKTFMGSLKRGAYPGAAGDAIDALNSYFQGIPAKNTPHRIKLVDLAGNPMNATEGKYYGDILQAFERSHRSHSKIPTLSLSWKSLSDSTAQGALKGIGNNIFQGVNLLEINADQNNDPFAEAEDLILAIFQILARNATKEASFTVPNGSFSVERIHDAAITRNGVNLKEIANKLLHGAISLYQASYHLSAYNADNFAPHSVINNYTTLEHNWDQAFGHFGAARDFALYSDMEAGKKLSRNSNGDGDISLAKEKNLGIAVNSARIDLVAQRDGEGGMDLSTEAIEAFTMGRHLISEKPSGYLQYVRANATVALGAWEKVIGGVVIHYLNSTLKTMDAYGTKDYSFSNHAKYWSEMKGYGLSFQFNPHSLLTPKSFEEFHQLVGDSPVLMSADKTKIDHYKKRLLHARDILQNAFDFTETNTKAF